MFKFTSISTCIKSDNSDQHILNTTQFISKWKISCCGLYCYMHYLGHFPTLLWSNAFEKYSGPPELSLTPFLVQTRYKNCILVNWNYLSHREDGTMRHGVDLIHCQQIMQNLLVLSYGQLSTSLLPILMPHGRTWRTHCQACFVHQSISWSLPLPSLLLAGDLNQMKATSDMAHCLVKLSALRISRPGWNFFHAVTKLASPLCCTGLQFIKDITIPKSWS